MVLSVIFSLTAAPVLEVCVVFVVFGAVVMVDVVIWLCDVMVPLVVVNDFVVEVIDVIAVGAHISICVNGICRGRLVVYPHFFPRTAVNDDRRLSTCWSNSAHIVSWQSSSNTGFL